MHTRTPPTRGQSIWAKEGVAAVRARCTGVGGSGEGVGAAASKHRAASVCVQVVCGLCACATHPGHMQGMAVTLVARLRREWGGVEMLLREEGGGDTRGGMEG